MSDQNAILIVLALAAIFFSLWVFNGKQKRKYEQERRKRKLELERLKAQKRDQAREAAKPDA